MNQLRDYFQIIPTDNTTRESLTEVNYRNYLVLFVVINLYLWNSWYYSPHPG